MTEFTRYNPVTKELELEPNNYATTAEGLFKKLNDRVGLTNGLKYFKSRGISFNDGLNYEQRALQFIANGMGDQEKLKSASFMIESTMCKQRQDLDPTGESVFETLREEMPLPGSIPEVADTEISFNNEDFLDEVDPCPDDVVSDDEDGDLFLLFGDRVATPTTIEPLPSVSSKGLTGTIQKPGSDIITPLVPAGETPSATGTKTTGARIAPLVETKTQNTIRDGVENQNNAGARKDPPPEPTRRTGPTNEELEMKIAELSKGLKACQLTHEKIDRYMTKDLVPALNTLTSHYSEMAAMQSSIRLLCSKAFPTLENRMNATELATIQIQKSIESITYNMSRVQADVSSIAAKLAAGPIGHIHPVSLLDTLVQDEAPKSKYGIETTGIQAWLYDVMQKSSFTTDEVRQKLGLNNTLYASAKKLIDRYSLDDIGSQCVLVLWTLSCNPQYRQYKSALPSYEEIFAELDGIPEKKKLVTLIEKMNSTDVLKVGGSRVTAVQTADKTSASSRDATGAKSLEERMARLRLLMGDITE